jgi:hypothetical protein
MNSPAVRTAPPATSSRRSRFRLARTNDVTETTSAATAWAKTPASVVGRQQRSRTCTATPSRRRPSRSSVSPWELRGSSTAGRALEAAGTERARSRVGAALALQLARAPTPRALVRRDRGGTPRRRSRLPGAIEGCRSSFQPLVFGDHGAVEAAYGGPDDAVGPAGRRPPAPTACRPGWHRGSRPDSTNATGRGSPAAPCVTRCRGRLRAAAATPR